MKSIGRRVAVSALIERATLAAAGLVAAFAAACCVIPVGAMILGIGGAWLSVLGPLVEWRGPILIVTGLVLLGFWARPLWERCACAGACGSGTMRGLASLLWAGAVAAPLWEGPATAALFRIWTDMP